MKIAVFDPSKVVDVVRRGFFLAYKASVPVGLGHLHERDNTTESEVWDCVKSEMCCPSADYVFGRMMKIGCEYDPAAGTIEVMDRQPRGDYQSWCVKYPTFAAPFEEAAKQLGTATKVVEPVLA